MQRRAFTLIELAIVLTIIGIIIGGSFKLFKIQKEKALATKAKENVLAAKEAVIGNTILNNNTLPDATFFDENLSPVANNEHKLFYADATALESTNACAFSTTNLKVETPSRTINNVAFVIASESSNHNMQTALKDNGDGTYSVKTYDYNDTVDDNTSPINIVENYDDIVQWVTLPQLKQNLECNQQRFAFVNTSLPSANEGESYSATLYVENNITSVTIDCTPTDDKGISYSNTTNTFSGTPSTSGTSERTCTATESSPSSRSITKKYVITINAAPAGGGGGGGAGGGGGGGGFPFP